MRATKKNGKKKHSWKNICYLSKLIFFGMCFFSPEIDCFFFENRQQSNACAGQIFFFFFVMRGLNFYARAHLKQRKKHRGLILGTNSIIQQRLYPVADSGGGSPSVVPIQNQRIFFVENLS